MKAWDKNIDSNLIKRSADAVAQSIPGLAIAWNLSKALYGNALELRQQRALEFVENIQANPKLFTQSLLNTEAFQDAFIVALEDYIKLRSTLKRGISKAIFNSSVGQEDLALFELERLDATLRAISPNALEFINFASSELEPIRQQRIEEDVTTFDLETSPIDQSVIRESIGRQQILSYAYDDWLQGRQKYDTVMVPSKKDSEYPTITGSGAVYVVSDDRLIMHSEALNELSVLGIIDRQQYSRTTAGWSSVPTWVDKWYYSEYGRRFIDHVRTAGQGEDALALDEAKGEANEHETNLQ